MALESQSLNLGLVSTVTSLQQSDTWRETTRLIKGNADHAVLNAEVLSGLKVYLKVTRNREMLWSQTYSALSVLCLWSRHLSLVQPRGLCMQLMDEKHNLNSKWILFTKTVCGLQDALVYFYMTDETPHYLIVNHRIKAFL